MGPAIDMVTSAKVFANDNGVAGPDLGDNGNGFLQGTVELMKHIETHKQRINFLTSRVKWHTEFEK